ncbi:MAG TPA: hypothetical protein VKR60_11255 [Candidatus Sulfotelmatobacter sp.]|nr:hypothetical protein [Candidatus Sulfotelmatobacter sp.]
MTDQNRSNDYRPEDAKQGVTETDALDRELDAALAKYAAVEPRAGLEARVLANLQAERELSSAHAAWGWPQVTALAAAVMILAALLVWLTGGRTQTVHHQSAATPHTQVAWNGTRSPERPATVAVSRKASSHSAHHAHRLARTVPKLRQFPSPQPLSEQEQMLANYVAKDPEHAVLVARARMEALRRDQSEEMQAFSSGPAADSERPSGENSDR